MHGLHDFLHYRLASVLRIMGSGVKQCTICLGPSGVKFILALCGVLIKSHKGLLKTPHLKILLRYNKMESYYSVHIISILG